MQIVLVQIHVKPECVEAFKEQTILNAQGSLQEPGVACFDFSQQIDDPCRFLLYEGYYNAEAVAAHKETAHYKVWRDAVNPMMASTRVGSRYCSIYPEDAVW